MKPPPPIELDPLIEQELHHLNPWWTDAAARPLVPSPRRHLAATVRRRMDLGLAPIVAVRGPRQAGKTTAQLQIVHDLLEEGVEPRRILRLQCDELPRLLALSEPILQIVYWYEENVLGQRLNDAAASHLSPSGGIRTFFFIDEMQILDAWAPQLKFLVDTSAVKVVATGSSALHIEAGRDSLAGRITTLDAGTLSLTEIALFHGIELGKPALPDNGADALGEISFWQELRDRGREVAAERDRAFALFATRGAYPRAHLYADSAWSDISDLLEETVIQRMLRHDLRIDDPAQPLRPVLFEELFRLVCRYAGQSPTSVHLAREAQRSLGTKVTPEDVLNGLERLADTLLVRLVRTLEVRLKRAERRDKLCLADHSLRACRLREVVPLTPAELAAAPHLAGLAGHLAESIAGAVLLTIRGLDLAHRPARGQVSEIDFVIVLGLKRIPMEVKYQRRIDSRRDTIVLRAFLDQQVNDAPFAVLLTQTDADVDDPRIVALPLASLMLLR